MKVSIFKAVAIALGLNSMSVFAYNKIGNVSADYDLRKSEISFLDIQVDLAQQKAKDKTILFKSDLTCGVAGVLENDSLPIHGQFILRCMINENKDHLYLHSDNRTILKLFAYGTSEKLKDLYVFGKILGLEKGVVVIDAQKIYKK